MARVCLGCGTCCTMFLINLTEGEYRSGRYRTQFGMLGPIDFAKAEMAGANTLRQRKDGSCTYLRGRRCSIHRSRPLSCREFFCSSRSRKLAGMIADIEQARDGPVAGRIKIKKL
jgi:Fe-S-cluster containining protein